MTKAMAKKELQDVCYRGRLYRVDLVSGVFGEKWVSRYVEARGLFPAAVLARNFAPRRALAYRTDITRIQPADFEREFQGVAGIAVQVAS